MTFPMPFFITSTPSPFSFSYIGHAGGSVSGTAKTFYSQPLGDLAPKGEDKRYIAVGVSAVHNANSNIASVTVSGIPATLAVRTANAQCPCAIFVALVPSGTTGDISITYSSYTAQSGIGIVRLINPHNPTGDDTAYSSAGSGAYLLNTNINALSGGSIFGIAQNRNGDYGVWSNLTERADFDLNSNDHFSVGTSSSSGSPVSISRTCNYSPNAHGVALASWS